MTRDEQAQVMEQLQAMRHTLQGMLAQVSALQSVVGRGLNSGAPERRTQHPEPPPEATDPNRQPPYEASNFVCPKCEGTMQWRFSKMNGQWFLGCTNFREQGCRGSISVEKAKEMTLGDDESKAPPTQEELDEHSVEQARRHAEEALDAQQQDKEVPF